MAGEWLHSRSMPAESSSCADERVIRRVLAGDRDAFAELLERHRDAVFRIVARHVPSADVAEVAHEAFVRAFMSLAMWTPDAPFEHWLARLALRAGCDFWRRAQRRNDLPPAGDRAAGECRVDGDATLDDREVLQWALAQLCVDDRLAVTLVHLEQMSIREAAAVLEWGESRVKVRAHRARRRLRELLAALDVFPDRMVQE